MNYGAVILAGGKGERFHGAKQFIEFHGKKLWEYPFIRMLSIADRRNIVVVGVDVGGGRTRTESVRIGLDNLPDTVDRVIILEAARPLVTDEQIKTLLEDEHKSVSLVKPLVNTVIKRSGEYLNREELYELLVPQAFDFHMLKRAYEEGNFENMTDETRVMFEFYSEKPFFIETGQNLFKVTYPEDLIILESLYQKQTGGNS